MKILRKLFTRADYAGLKGAQVDFLENERNQIAKKLRYERNLNNIELERSIGSKAKALFKKFPEFNTRVGILSPLGIGKKKYSPEYVEGKWAERVSDRVDTRNWGHNFSQYTNLNKATNAKKLAEKIDPNSNRLGRWVSKNKKLAAGTAIAGTAALAIGLGKED